METKRQKADQGEFITCKEAAQMLRMSEASIRRYLTIGKLRRYKVGSHTLVNYTEARGLICDAGPQSRHEGGHTPAQEMPAQVA